jgi:hypothetical protein
MKLLCSRPRASSGLHSARGLQRDAIRNCHVPTPGISGPIGVYSTPLRFMESSGVRFNNEKWKLLDSTIFHDAAGRARPNASLLAVSTPPRRPNSPAQNPVRRLARKHCAAQAEYVRLAAQAYSPSDAMSQASSWSGLRQKGSTPGALNSLRTSCDWRAETAGFADAYLLAEGGVGPARLPRTIAPPLATPLHSPMWRGRPASPPRPRR